MNLKYLEYVLSKNAPNILTALSITGVVSTTVLAITATPVALTAIKQSEIDFYMMYGDDAEFSQLERLKPGMKFYIPTLISGILTIVCILGANRVSSGRTAALAALYSASETSLKDYQRKVIETFGEKKELKLREDIAEEKLLKNPVMSEDNVILTGRGKHLFFDSLSGRYFYSDVEYIRSKINDFNQAMLNGDMYKSLNEFYHDIGLEATTLGSKMGWDIDHLLDVDFIAKLTNLEYVAEVSPCIVLEYKVTPKYL